MICFDLKIYHLSDSRSSVSFEIVNKMRKNVMHSPEAERQENMKKEVPPVSKSCF